MSVVVAMNAIADVLETVAASSTPTFRVFRLPPVALATADLPAVILLHRGGTFTWHATRLRRAQYAIDVVIVVEAVAQQRQAERISVARQLYDIITNALLNAPTLNAAVDHIDNIRDVAGYSVINWGGVDYFCYTLSCDVVVKSSV